MKIHPRLIPVGIVVVAVALGVGFQQASRRPAVVADPLIEGFRKSTVASVSDAVDQVVGVRGFMSHDMAPRIPGKIVGRATTAILKPAPPEAATPTLSAKHSVAMIDEAKPGDVGVIVVEGSLDVAGLGGLMATAAKSRNMAGVILDGGVRDLAEIRALGLPVYSRSVVPSSSVGRWASVAKDIEVQCAGVRVRPGDIIVAGEDGVVVVPQERAQEVLKRAQEIDERETKMVPFIKQYRSLTKAIEVFNRI
ncbi:MAG: RraA family protein [Bryobacteraceae bacterium]|nr:RraA family protein [Bryobacteraceae bacterium]MDW8376580.1 RraA family protein [Bryobacterales bacterium]